MSYRVSLTSCWLGGKGFTIDSFTALWMASCGAFSLQLVAQHGSKSGYAPVPGHGHGQGQGLSQRTLSSRLPRWSAKTSRLAVWVDSSLLQLGFATSSIMRGPSGEVLHESVCRAAEKLPSCLWCLNTEHLLCGSSVCLLITANDGGRPSFPWVTFCSMNPQIETRNARLCGP